MAKIYGLSEEDLRILKGIIEQVRKLPPSSPEDDQEESPHQAPEVYIAKVPSTGIPTLETSGTGTAPEPGTTDTAGSAECDIYRINENDRFEAIEGLSKTVYNLTKDKIISQWLPIVRDKYGKWLAIPPPGILLGWALSFGNGNATVRFNIFGSGVSKGLELDTEDEVSAYVRYGAVVPGKLYYLAPIVPSDSVLYEVINPDVVLRGQATGDVASGAFGAVNVYTGPFSGESLVDNGPHLTQVYNDASCVVEGSPYFCTILCVPTSGWIFVVGRTNPTGTGT